MRVTGHNLRAMPESGSIDNRIRNAAFLHLPARPAGGPCNGQIDRDEKAPGADRPDHLIHPLPVFTIKPFQFRYGNHGSDPGLRSLNVRPDPLIAFPVLNPDPGVGN